MINNKCCLFSKTGSFGIKGNWSELDVSYLSITSEQDKRW